MPTKENGKKKNFLDPIYVTKDFEGTYDDFKKILDNTHGDYAKIMRSLVEHFVKNNRKFLEESLYFPDCSFVLESPVISG